MENFRNILNKAGWIATLESVIFVILGCILVCKPEGTIKVTSWILGTLFIIIGICKIINYFIEKGRNDFYNHNLTYGLTAIVIGIISMSYMNIIGAIFRIIIGVWIMHKSFARINSAIVIKRVEGKAWFWSLILAIIMFVTGLYITINSGTIIITIGFVMIIYSVIDLIENIIFMKNVKKMP